MRFALFALLVLLEVVAATQALRVQAAAIGERTKSDATSPRESSPRTKNKRFLSDDDDDDDDDSWDGWGDDDDDGPWGYRFGWH
jgi:hypothetical protein